MDWNFELLCKPFGSLTEGPVWNGEVIRFTDIPNGRIYQHDPRDGTTTLWRDNLPRVNGLGYDPLGRLFGCSPGGRSILRFDPDGTSPAVVEHLDGKRLNTPNDLVIDIQGRIWFSNPWSQTISDPAEKRELEDGSVLRADPQKDGSYIVRRMTLDTLRPNGVLLSADEKTLYVAESGFSPDNNRELRAYDINADGSLGGYDLLHTFGIDRHGLQRGVDGMCLDVDGNIIACAGWDKAGPGGLIYVFSPRGRVIQTHRVPARQPTNCCFGGPDMRTLYVTSFDGHLISAKTDRKGWTLYP